MVIRFRIGMAADTGKLRIIRRVCVAILTCIPGAFVRAAVNRKMVNVMLCVFGRHPVGVSGMTFNTVLRETGALVIRIYG